MWQSQDFFLLNDMSRAVELEHYIYATNQVSQISLLSLYLHVQNSL